MMRHIRLVLCLIATLSIAGLAQIASSTSPAAFVYVSGSPSNNHYEINAFTAASDGKLTPVSGSPFPANVQSMAVNEDIFSAPTGLASTPFRSRPMGRWKRSPPSTPKSTTDTIAADQRRYSSITPAQRCMTKTSMATFAPTTPINLLVLIAPRAS